MSARRQISVSSQTHKAITESIPVLMKTNRDYPFLFESSPTADNVMAEMISLFYMMYGDSDMISLISKARLIMMERNNLDKPANLQKLLKWVLQAYID